MLIAILEDNAFRKRMNIPYEKRWTVRVFAYNEQGELVFLKIQGSDSFGKRDHLETIGGGVENDETLEDTLRREVREEVGYECEILEELGSVVDHYNLINRETISTYFVVKLTKYHGEIDRSASEMTLIHGTVSLSEEEALKKLNTYSKNTINELVQRRDYYALKHYMSLKEKREKN